VAIITGKSPEAAPTSANVWPGFISMKLRIGVKVFSMAFCFMVAPCVKGFTLGAQEIARTTSKAAATELKSFMFIAVD
jgi:hypothetical protein